MVRILAARLSIYHSPIITFIENAENHVLATVVLHNFLRLTDNAVYKSVVFFDSQGLTCEIQPGGWRLNVDDISPIPNVHGSRYSNNVTSM